MTYQLPEPVDFSDVPEHAHVWGYTADQMQAAYAAGRESMRQECECLKKFALKILDGFPDIGLLDGGDIYEIAVYCGLLIGKEVNEPCGEGCNCIEYSDLDPEGKFLYPITCYHKTEFLK